MKMDKGIRAWAVSMAALVGFLLIAYLTIGFLLPAVLPFALALLFAYLIERPVAWLEKRRLPRAAAVALVLLVAGAMIVAVVFWLVTRLVLEIRDLYSHWPYYVTVGQDLMQRLFDQLGALSDRMPPGMADTLTAAMNRGLQALQSALPGLASALTAVSTLTGFLADLGIAVIATFFISRDRATVVSFLARFLPPGWRPALGHARRAVFASLAGYLKAVAILITITAVLTSLGLWLVGSDFALLLGVLTGLADLVPLVGTTVVFGPWIIYQFLFGSGSFAVKLLLVYLVQLATRQAMEPKLVGERMGIHPLTVLFTAYVGYRIFGAMGFIWGPLLAIFTKALVKSGVLPAFQGEPPAGA